MSSQCVLCYLDIEDDVNSIELFDGWVHFGRCVRMYIQKKIRTTILLKKQTTLDSLEWISKK